MAISDDRASELLTLAIERLGEVRSAIGGNAELPDAAGKLRVIISHLIRWSLDTGALLDQDAASWVLAAIEAYKPSPDEWGILPPAGPHDFARFLHPEKQEHRRAADRQRSEQRRETTAAAIDGFLRDLRALRICAEPRLQEPRDEPAPSSFLGLHMDEERCEMSRDGYRQTAEFRADSAQWHWVKTTFLAGELGATAAQIRNGYPGSVESNAMRQAKRRAADRLKCLGVTLSHGYPVKLQAHSKM